VPISAHYNSRDFGSTICITIVVLVKNSGITITFRFERDLMQFLSASLESQNRIVLTFDQHASAISKEHISFSPSISILGFRSLAHIIEIETSELDISENYTVFVKGKGNLPLVLATVLDGFSSTKALGCGIENNRFIFRVFSPRASKVTLVLTRSLDDNIGTQYEMTRDDEGVWELSLTEGSVDPFYGYRIEGPVGSTESFDPSIVVADPYAGAVVSKNTHAQESFSIIEKHGPQFDWGNDGFISLKPQDATIYEMHIRDMTIHPSSGIDRGRAGSYLGLTEGDKRGGLEYISSLGVNAVELLPSQHFARIEPHYKQLTKEGFYNTWNPYELNHWGYMTSFFFAPEPSYASGAELQRGQWNNVGTRHVTEFKEMVKSFHSRGIAVIMDVVYNHTSQYNQQPLKYLAKHYYYRIDKHGKLLAASGCGNDFYSCRPFARRLIIDSVLHWMQEYHVDGFRFDLASLIDRETFEELREKAMAINPDVILIAEPWGGGNHDLDQFSEIGYSAWNDDFRNSVKGENPLGARGYIFGSWGWNSPEAFGKWVLGSTEEKGGPFKEAGHSVNYLESHDGYTLGDFIRIGSGEHQLHEPVKDSEQHAVLSSAQMKLNKLAALMLLSSKGVVMLHAGQEFARSKIIAKRELSDIEAGLMDENSYEKDDETNWIDYHTADLNGELLQYYQGLIAIRSQFPELRESRIKSYEFLIPDASLASGYVIHTKKQSSNTLAFLINPNPHQDAIYELPEGVWRILADGVSASPDGKQSRAGGKITVPVSSGMILLQIR
jgi:pullulanase